LQIQVYEILVLVITDNKTACADFSTGIDVGQHNCLLIYWRTVCHAHFCVITQQNATFLGVGTRGLGPWPTNWNMGEIFVLCTKPPSFIILWVVWKLSCWQTPTNKQTPLKTSTSLRY